MNFRSPIGSPVGSPVSGLSIGDPFGAPAPQASTQAVDSIVKTSEIPARAIDLSSVPENEFTDDHVRMRIGSPIINRPPVTDLEEKFKLPRTIIKLARTKSSVNLVAPIASDAKNVSPVTAFTAVSSEQSVHSAFVALPSIKEEGNAEQKQAAKKTKAESVPRAMPLAVQKATSVVQLAPVALPSFIMPASASGSMNVSDPMALSSFGVIDADPKTLTGKGEAKEVVMQGGSGEKIQQAVFMQEGTPDKSQSVRMRQDTPERKHTASMHLATPERATTSMRLDTPDKDHPMRSTPEINPIGPKQTSEVRRRLFLAAGAQPVMQQDVSGKPGVSEKKQPATSKSSSSRVRRRLRFPKPASGKKMSASVVPPSAVAQSTPRSVVPVSVNSATRVSAPIAPAPRPVSPDADEQWANEMLSQYTPTIWNEAVKKQDMLPPSCRGAYRFEEILESVRTRTPL